MKMIQRLTRRPAGLLAAVVLVLGVAGAAMLGHAAKADNPALAPARGDTQYFLKLDGIEGDSTDEVHKGEIELKSFAWAQDGPGVKVQTDQTGGGGSTGKALAGEISFEARTSKASPKLMTTAVSGKHLKEAVLSVRRSQRGKQQEYYRITLTEVLVSSYRVSGFNDAPNDQFSLNFAKIKQEYTPLNADGSPGTPVTGTWDVKENRAE